MAARKKLKPRGNPSKILPYRWKKGESGNPRGRSQKVRISDAVVDELSQVVDAKTGVTRAGLIASNLLTRAEHDSTELERVLKITEPELAGKNFSSGGMGLSVQTEDVSVVFQKLGLD